MDIITISDLKISTTIGVYEWEKRIKQTLLISLDMAHDIRQAAATDDVQHALNYAAVAKATEQFCAEHTFQLIETLAEKLAALLKQQFGIDWLRVKVAKPGAVKNARETAVTIER